MPAWFFICHYYYVIYQLCFLVLVTVRFPFCLCLLYMILLETLWNTNYGAWSCKCFGHCRLGFPDEWILRLSDFREPSGPSTDWPTRSNFAAPWKTIEVGILESKDREDQQECFPNWYSKWTPSNSVRQGYRFGITAFHTVLRKQLMISRWFAEVFQDNLLSFDKLWHIGKESMFRVNVRQSTHIFTIYCGTWCIVNHHYDSVLSMMYYECGGDLGPHILFQFDHQVGHGWALPHLKWDIPPDALPGTLFFSRAKAALRWLTHNAVSGQLRFIHPFSLKLLISQHKSVIVYWCPSLWFVSINHECSKALRPCDIPQSQPKKTIDPSHAGQTQL